MKIGLCLGLLFGLAGSLAAQKKPKAFAQQLKTLTQTLSGVYEFRLTDPKLPAAVRVPQDILVLPIWEVKNEQWFYFAWLHADNKESPLEQSLWRVYRDSTEKIRCDFHRLPDPKEYVQEWKKKKPFAGLNPNTILGETTVCEGEFRHAPEGFWEALTFKPCPKGEESAAPYSSMSIRIRFDGKTFGTGTKYLDSKGGVVMQYNYSFPAPKTHTHFRKY